MTLRLTRLDSQLPISNPDGTPSPQFQRLQQKDKESIEAAVASLQDQVADIAAALAAGVAAQASATASARELARISSYTDPTNVLSAADDGTTATITIAAHDRIYPVQGSVDVPDISILTGSVALLLFSTEYHTYYDDTTLADTTPTFQATTDRATAQVGAAAGRHFLGSITTPADGGGGTTGTGGFPPGGGGGGVLA